MSHLFISYSRKDKPFVQGLSDALGASGHEAWVDWEGIAPSAKWMAEILAAIDAATAIVFVISPDSMASKVCGEELAYALKENKRIIPVVARPADGIPATLAEINWIVFPTPDDREATASLLRALDTDPAWVAAHTRLNVRAHEWDRATRDASFLLRGRDLAAAEAWLADAANHAEARPTDLHTQYILASRAAQTSSQRKQLWAAAGAVVVALSLAVWALFERDAASDNARLAVERAAEATRQRGLAETNAQTARDNAKIADQRRLEAERQTRLARARELAAQSVAQLDADPETGLHLALASMDMTRTPQGEEAMLRSLAASRATAVLGGDCSVASASFSRSGRHVSAVCTDGSVAVWDLQRTDRKARDLPLLRTGGATWRIGATVLDPDERRLFAAGTDGVVRVFRLADGVELARLAVKGARLSSLAIDPAGRWLFAYGAQGGVQVYRLAGLKPVARLAPASTDIQWVRFPPESQHVAVLAREAGPSSPLIVRYWDAAGGQVMPAQGGHEVFPNGSLFNAEGTRLLTKGDDEISEHWQPVLWDLLQDRRLGELARPAGRWSVAAIDAQDGIFMSYPARPVLQYWRADASGGTPTLVTEFIGHAERIAAVALFERPGDTRVLTASEDGTARLWRPDSAQATAVLRGHRGAVSSIAFSPDGDSALTTGADGSARVWRLDDTALGRPSVVAEGRFPWALRASDDAGRIVALVSTDGMVRLYDSVQRQRLLDLWPPGMSPGRPGERDRVSVVLSPNGDRVLVGNTASGLAVLRDSRSGTVLHELSVGSGRPSARFSADGSRLLLPSPPRLVDAATGAVQGALQGLRAYVDEVASSADGAHWFALDSGREVVLHWDVPTYGAGRLWPTPRKVTAMAVSPDGRWLALADRSARVQLWDVAQRRVVLERGFDAHRLAFSRDGQRLAAQSFDGALRVWGTERGDQQLDLLPTPGDSSVLRFSVDDRLLITGAGVRLVGNGLRIDGSTPYEQRGMPSADGLRVFRSVDGPNDRSRFEVVDCLPCQDGEALTAFARSRTARADLSPQQREQFGLDETAPVRPPEPVR